MMFGTDTIDVRLRKEVLKVKDENIDKVLNTLSKEKGVQRFFSHRGLNFVHERDRIVNRQNNIEHRFYVEPINFVTVYYYESQ